MWTGVSADSILEWLTHDQELAGHHAVRALQAIKINARWEWGPAFILGIPAGCVVPHVVESIPKHGDLSSGKIEHFQSSNAGLGDREANVHVPARMSRIGNALAQGGNDAEAPAL